MIALGVAAGGTAHMTTSIRVESLQATPAAALPAADGGHPDGYRGWQCVVPAHGIEIVPQNSWDHRRPFPDAVSGSRRGRTAN